MDLIEVQGITSCITSMKKEIGTLEAELRNYFLQPKSDKEVTTSPPSLGTISESKSSMEKSDSILSKPSMVDQGKIVPSGSTEFLPSKQVQGSSMNNGDKTLSTHFTTLVYIKSFFIKLVANLSLQVLIFIQDFCLKGVIITQSQNRLALNCLREVYDENCSFDSYYNSEFLVQIFELKLPIIIQLPPFLEVQHYDFVFGNRIFLHENIAYSLIAENSDFQLVFQHLEICVLNTCFHSILIDFHPCSCVPNLDEIQLVLFDPGGTCFSKHDVHFHEVFYCSQNPILCSDHFLLCSSSFSHYLILMHLCWFSGCRGKVRGRIYLGKVSTSFEIYVLDSRTSLFEDGGNDENMDTASPNLRLNH